MPRLPLCAGAAHSRRAQTPDVVALGYVVALDAALLTVVAWTVAELGVRPLLFKAAS